MALPTPWTRREGLQWCLRAYKRTLRDHIPAVESAISDQKRGQVRGSAVKITLDAGLTEPSNIEKRHAKEITCLCDVLTVEISC